MQSLVPKGKNVRSSISKPFINKKDWKLLWLESAVKSDFLLAIELFAIKLEDYQFPVVLADEYVRSAAAGPLSWIDIWHILGVKPIAYLLMAAKVFELTSIPWIEA